VQVRVLDRLARGHADVHAKVVALRPVLPLENRTDPRDESPYRSMLHVAQI